MYLTTCFLQIQMLHCIANSEVEGGENQFVDGLHVAEQIRRENLETFQLLTTQRVDFRVVGTDYVRGYHQRNRVPIIQ